MTGSYTYIHACIHTHTCVYTHIHTYICTYMYMCAYDPGINKQIKIVIKFSIIVTPRRPDVCGDW